MNNITFIIGNGFDLGLGLKTKYKDFYPYFLEKNKDNIIAKLLKQDIIDNKINDWNELFQDELVQNDFDINKFRAIQNGEIDIWRDINNIEIETWADLEIKLGELTSNIQFENYNQFRNDKMDMDICLIDYINEEYEKHSFTKQEFAEIRKSLLQKMYIGNDPTETEFIGTHLKINQNQSRKYNLINFNYTFCADLLFSDVKVVDTRQLTSNSVVEDRFQTTLHIHGTMKSDEAIIGVNDESQILNKTLLQNTSISDFMIKTNQNKAVGRNNTEKGMDIIDNSFILCLYGVSLGKSDQIWWDKIGQWLKSNKDFLLVLFYYYPEDKLPPRYYRHRQEKVTVRNNVKDELLNILNIDSSDESIKDRIIIHINDFIFKDIFNDIENNVI